MIRQPAVAGQFYPASASQLAEEVEAYLDRAAEPAAAVAAVVPHAGYTYSGPVAGAVYSRLEIPETVVIMAPNHTGLGAPIAVWSTGDWLTPLGRVAVDEGLASALLEQFSPATSDDQAHLTEHSIEVQLPFLQALRADVAILPIVLSLHSLATIKELGQCLADLVEQHVAGVLVLASTDMTHFQPQEVAERYDRLALERVLALDPDGLWQVVLENDISMCGYMPTTAALAYARARGASSAELVRYETSGDRTGDRSSVVGYAGLIID
ncbi:MAG: AmmeMemoRadiSam system protein B [Planctomycetes bacterium]|nr:AmmeMemoRadiSam system protein B [Planctomycetota bacterium]